MPEPAPRQPQRETATAPPDPRTQEERPSAPRPSIRPFLEPVYADERTPDDIA